MTTTAAEVTAANTLDEARAHLGSAVAEATMSDPRLRTALVRARVELDAAAARFEETIIVDDDDDDDEWTL